MEWTEVIIRVPVSDVDRAGDIAQMVVPYGIYIEDYSHLEEEAGEIAHIDLFDEALLQKDRSDLTDKELIKYPNALSKATSRMVVLTFNFE